MEARRLEGWKATRGRLEVGALKLRDGGTTELEGRGGLEAERAVGFY